MRAENAGFSRFAGAGCAMRGTVFATSSGQNGIIDEEAHVIGGKKAVGTFVVAAMVVAWFTLPAYSQSTLAKRPGNGGYDGPPPENKPKIDEKAYKSALERIPEPDKKYDPWGIARPAESAKPGKKSN
jgi:hypothetical protein